MAGAVRNSQRSKRSTPHSGWICSSQICSCYIIVFFRLSTADCSSMQKASRAMTDIRGFTYFRPKVFLSMVQKYHCWTLNTNFGPKIHIFNQKYLKIMTINTLFGPKIPFWGHRYQIWTKKKQFQTKNIPFNDRYPKFGPTNKKDLFQVENPKVGAYIP